MTSLTPDVQSVLERLGKLERQNRRLKRAGSLALTAVAALLLMGQATPESRTIEAERFIVIDSAGKTRAVLSMILDGPHLVMYDEKGEMRVNLRVGPDGPLLAFDNEAGKPQTELTAVKGFNGLLTYNYAGTPSTVLGEEEKGPALRLFDADGKPHIELWSTNQAPQMSFRDAAGRERAVMYLEPQSGAPSIAFYDQREKIMTALYAAEMGPTLRLNDSDENPRVELGVRKDGAPSLHMWDVKGNVTWSIPTENVASTTSTGGGASGESLADLENAIIIADDGQFLGKITTSSIDPKSIINSIGPYGSDISPTSIFNDIGKYGGDISPLSPFNDITSTPPRIFRGDRFIGYLTVNTIKTPRVDPRALVGWLKSQE